MHEIDEAEWIRQLSTPGPFHNDAVKQLRDLALQAARKEAARRAYQLRVQGPELDDIADQAASDAVIAIMQKLAQFRGQSKFTTWAYKFVIYEVSTKITRHFWMKGEAAIDDENWELVPARAAFDPADAFEWHELKTALQHAVDTELTPHQRTVFSAVVMRGVPVDVVAFELATNRNAIYKVLFDARRKLHSVLATTGYFDNHR